MVLEAVQVDYCGACGMPPEYCEYGPDFETHCLPWLKQNHWNLFNKLHSKRTLKQNYQVEAEEEEERPQAPWTTEERLVAFYEEYLPEKIDGVPALMEKYEGKYDKLFMALVKKYGPEPQDPYYDNDDEEELAAGMENVDITKKKRRGVAAKKITKVDTRVVIQKISRNRKKAVTIVVGMDTVPHVHLKDVAKAFSKRFAGSSSVKNGTHGKEIIIQGDHMEAVANMVVTKFKVSPDSVFLDENGEFVPFNER